MLSLFIRELPSKMQIEPGLAQMNDLWLLKVAVSSKCLLSFTTGIVVILLEVL